MAHWRLTPSQIRELTDDELETMESAFLLQERRQSETLDSVVGSLLGVTWDVNSLLGSKDGNQDVKAFTWSLRHRTQKVVVPLAASLTQNPKFFEQLKAKASSLKWSNRENAAILDTPKWLNDKNRKYEIVDLSEKTREEFLEYARRIPT